MLRFLVGKQRNSCFGQSLSSFVLLSLEGKALGIEEGRVSGNESKMCRTTLEEYMCYCSSMIFI
jgi:hypothetical protein